MKKKGKVHKNGCDGPTPCGLPTWKYLKRSNTWDFVECKNCLRNKPQSKVYSYDNNKTLEENERELNKQFPLENKFEVAVEKETKIDDLDEVFDEAAEKETKQKKYNKTPFDKWEEWFKLCCDHPFSPQSDEVWNGAIDTVCVYLRNELCVIDGLGLSGADEILNKVKKKFKTE